MIRRPIFLLILVGIISVGITLMVYSHVSGSSRLSRALAHEIAKTFDTRAKELSITNVTDFAWDKMFIFGPYTPIDTMEKALGYSWKGLRESGIEMNDGYCLFVFMSKGHVTHSCTLSRVDGDFAKVCSTNSLTPTEAKFSISREPSGWISVDKK